jgi:methionyl-tRNA formyltransferase
MELSQSPVKILAREAGLEVLQPAKARTPEFHDEMATLSPDVAVVVAYGKILPASLLSIPRHGFVNVHFSLLPAYRGAAPVQRALMDGVDVTGVSIMVLTEGMDEGPLLAERTLAVAPDQTAGEVGSVLAEVGAELLIPTLHDYVEGRLEPIPQDNERATYAPKLTSEDARIDWADPAVNIHNLVRGLNPAPGAWTMLREGRLKIYRTKRSDGPRLSPGQLHPGEKLLVGASDGNLELVELQLAGKRRMGGPELAHGVRLDDGERLR